MPVLPKHGRPTAPTRHGQHKNSWKKMVSDWTNKIATGLSATAVFIEKVRQHSISLACNPRKPTPFMCLLLVVEIIINLTIVLKVPYTEIDWKAYMQEVEGFWNGTKDYEQLKGDTGPLVYPAGFVYIFLALYHLTSNGINIKLAQWIFVGVYITFLITVFRIYKKIGMVPPWAFAFMCLASYRIHSLFALRLFNDPIVMLLFYGSLNLLLDERWTMASLLFSFAVSVKMNVLLFAPALGVTLLAKVGWRRLIVLVLLCALLQMALGAPFLLENPEGYIVRSFEISRQFFYKWTVNWRCIPEWLFLDRRFQLCLLSMHLGLLFFFAHFRWTSSVGGIFAFLKDPSKLLLSNRDMVRMFFVSNLIGIACSRSLHYQFYVWYYHTLYFLLWDTTTGFTGVRLLILGLIEYCWNTYPSTLFSSFMLHLSHLVILILHLRPSTKLKFT